MIKVSIIVPIYNVEKYIGILIESLQKQTLKEIEIILVDDGSPDSSGKICDEYAEIDSRIKVIHKQNGGVSAARNDGLKVAIGEYVIFCDSDDWLPLDAIESLYHAGISDCTDVVIGDVIMSKKEQETLVQLFDKSFVTNDKTFIKQLTQTMMYRTFCPCPPSNGIGHFYGGPWNKLVKKSLLVENNIKFDERVKGIFDDVIYSTYVIANANTVAYIQKPVYYYRIIPVSITRTFKANALEINNAIFECWDEFLSKYDDDGTLKKAYHTVVIRRFAEIMPIYFFSEKNTKSKKLVNEEIKRLLKSEPYRSAISHVNVEKLSLYQKLLHKTMKIGSPVLIGLLFYIKTKAKTLFGSEF